MKTITYNQLFKSTLQIKKFKKNTKEFLSCSKYVLNNRSTLFKKSIIQSSLSATSDIILEVKLDNHNDFMTFDYIHFFDNYLATYILSSIIFFIYDSVEEFRKCSNSECTLD